MKKFLKSKILWLVLIVVVAVIFLMQRNAGKGLEVETIQPVKTNLTQTIVVSGQLQAIDTDTIRIPQGTYVETVSVREGDVVKRGQALASGDTTDLSKITYTATLDGVVTRVIPSAGRKAGVDAYIRIDDLSGYLVESFVPQEDALSLEKGQTANVRIKGKNTEAYPATVLSVGQYAAIEAASGSQALRVRVLFALDPISDKTLPVGYEADVEVVTGTAPEAWTVLREAIGRNDAGAFVWTVMDGKASAKPVRVLLQDDTRAAVEGLDGTETIIALPYMDLSDNTPVISVKKEAGQ